MYSFLRQRNFCRVQIGLPHDRAEIDVIVAFKVKGRTGDELRVEVIFDDCAIRISQDAPGWHQFVVKTREVFPTIPDQWDLEMLIPSFAIDLMVLYKKPEA